MFKTRNIYTCCCFFSNYDNHWRQSDGTNICFDWSNNSFKYFLILLDPSMHFTILSL